MPPGHLIRYIENLEAEAEKRRAERDRQQAELNTPLDQKIRIWWALLPEELRKARYSMAEFVSLFHVSPGRLGIALTALGWERKREWAAKNYTRYWIPPHNSVAAN